VDTVYSATTAFIVEQETRAQQQPGWPTMA